METVRKRYLITTKSKANISVAASRNATPVSQRTALTEMPSDSPMNRTTSASQIHGPKRSRRTMAANTATYRNCV